MGQGILTPFRTFVHYGIGNLTLLNTFLSIVHYVIWNLTLFGTVVGDVYDGIWIFKPIWCFCW